MSESRILIPAPLDPIDGNWLSSKFPTTDAIISRIDLSLMNKAVAKVQIAIPLVAQLEAAVHKSTTSTHSSVSKDSYVVDSQSKSDFTISSKPPVESINGPSSTLSITTIQPRTREIPLGVPKYSNDAHIKPKQKPDVIYLSKSNELPVQKNTERGKTSSIPIIRIDMNGVSTHYESISAAAKSNNCVRNSISRALSRPHYKCKGYAEPHRASLGDQNIGREINRRSAVQCEARNRA